LPPARQAPPQSIRFASDSRWRVAALFCSFALSGCGLSSLGAADVDRSLVTSNVPAASAADPERRSDEATIRNAVSSADLAQAGPEPLAWANADTGSRGAITGVEESRKDGELCRRFTATRESFDGVGLFKGKACMVAPGAWQLTAFAPP